MPSRWRNVVALISVALLMGTPTALARDRPKTPAQKKEERFVQCLLAMEDADQDRDDRLSRPEYPPFVRSLSQLLFEDQVELMEEDELPNNLARLFPMLIPMSGAKDNDAIDIFGARMGALFSVSEERLHRLRAVCEVVLKELAMLGPRTDAPLQLMDLLETEEELKEEEEAHNTTHK